MNELKNAVETAISDDTGQGIIDLHDTGKKWATYCLDMFTGDLLAKGLEISKAIADFTLELKEPGHGR